MTLQRRPTGTGGASDRLDAEFRRLLCDDGHYATRRDGAGKTQDSRGVDGWSATGLDAASRIRQENRVSVRNWIWPIADTECPSGQHIN